MRAWADSWARWGLESGSRPSRASQRDPVGGQAGHRRRRARLPPLRPGPATAVEANLTQLSRTLLHPSRTSTATASLPLRGRRQRLFAGWALLRMLDRGGAARDAAYEALRSWRNAFGVAEQRFGPADAACIVHMITHLSQDDEAAKWMALVFPSEQLCSSLEGCCSPATASAARTSGLEMMRSRCGCWAGIGPSGSSKGQCKGDAEHCGRGLVAAITQPGGTSSASGSAPWH